MCGRTMVQSWRWMAIAALALASDESAIAPAHKLQTLNRSPVEQSAQEIPSQAEAELQTGIALTRSGHFAEAIPHFLAARGHVSDQYAAEFNLALCYVGTRKNSDAIRILNELRKNEHENAAVENLLAQAYAKEGASNKAFEALHRAAEFTPKDEKLYVFVADAFLERREYSLSLRVIEFGVEHLPGSARLHYERGYLLELLDETDAAKTEFESTTALAPHSEIGYLAAAQENLMAGNVSRAVEVARAGIKEGHTDYQLLAALGRALVLAGASPGQAQFSEAKDALEKSIAARPNYVSSQTAIGHLFLLEGNLDKAIEHLESSRHLDAQNLSVYPLLATAYRRRGQPEKAQAALAILTRLNQEQVQKIRTAPGDNKAIPGAASAAVGGQKP